MFPLYNKNKKADLRLSHTSLLEKSNTVVIDTNIFEGYSYIYRHKSMAVSFKKVYFISKRCTQLT